LIVGGARIVDCKTPITRLHRFYKVDAKSALVLPDFAASRQMKFLKVTSFLFMASDWIVPFANRISANLMRTRSGLQYRRSGFGRQWSGPNLARRTLAARRTFARSQTLQRRRRPTSGIGITTQHDERRIYRKRSMPRRQRRRWKMFKNKVLAVSEKDLGTRTVVFNATYSIGNNTAGNHTIGEFALYPIQSSAPQLNDMNNITGTEAGDWTASKGGVVDSTTKFIFKSAILDLTFRNSSTYFTTAGGSALDSRAKLETDIYEIISDYPFDDASGTYPGLGATLTAGATDTLNIGGAGTGLLLTQRGVTPWDFPAALSRFKIKILKKTKFMTPNGDTFTYQIRDPRRRVSNKVALTLGQGPNKRGWTRWVLIFSKLVPGLTIGTSDGTYQENLTIGVTRKYFYKIEGQSEDRDRYIVA